MTGIDLSRAEWQKSSHSGQSGNCVEVARNLPGLVAVRDSKDTGGAQAGGLAGDLAGIYRRHPAGANGRCRGPGPLSALCLGADITVAAC